MLATFVLTEPMLLAAALGALAAAGMVARRLPAPGPEAAGGPGWASAGSAGAGRHWSAIGIAALVGWGIGALLALAHTAAAGLVLLLLAWFAAGATVTLTYRREAVRLGRSAARACAAARTIVWVVLLVLVARPQWNRTVVEWDKPLLAVVLDDTRSMAIVDRERSDGRSRARIANEALAAAGTRLARLERFFELRFVAVGDAQPVADGWRIVPGAPASPVGAALRRAAQARSTHGAAPVAIVLVSDGAENVASPQVLREIGGQLASQKTALIALGVGPAAGTAPMVRFEPLVVPGRVGSRDRLRIPVVARVEGCAGHELELEVAWGSEVAATRHVAIGKTPARIDEEFELRAPGVGLHRLGVVARLPAALGGDTFETSVIVDVRDDRMHVLVVEAQPRNAMAFAVRAIAGDPRFDLAQRLLLAPSGAAAPGDDVSWADYDVVVLGSVPARRLGRDGIRALVEAVRDGGVGLMLAGGRSFFHDAAYNGSLLEEISPVEFRAKKPSGDYRPRLRPTPAGLRHPILRGIAGDAEHALWDRLPPLGGAARFGPTKALAVVLATDEDGRPLLVAQEAGRGRVVAAAWDSIWTWALDSDEGLAAHHRLWRQLLGWLANRRPVAWIVTDRSEYARDALATGRQTVRIRAGLSGGERPGASNEVAAAFQASLRLRRAAPPATAPASRRAAGSGPPSPVRAAAATPERPRPIPLRREGNDWVASLPRDLPEGTPLEGGAYELELTIERGGGERGPEAGHDVFTARTGFAVRAVDLELTEPTANLALLRELAAMTQTVGGGYHPVEEVAGVADELLQHDQRRRIDHERSYDPVARHPWTLLVVAVAALTAEWVIRKRGGLA